MKKIVAMILSIALTLPAASLLAQQAPATPAKQPVQVAQGGNAPPTLFGLGPVASITIMVVAVIAAAAAVNDDFTNASATATR